MSNNALTRIETAIKIGLIALLRLWCFQIVASFISPIVWAGIIVIAVYPIIKRLQKLFPASITWRIVTILSQHGNEKKHTKKCTFSK